jgi:hypothetical protein
MMGMAQVSISGTVADNSNEPLPGASVSVKGTTNGTSTDFDGKFSINAVSGDVLVISYIGYKTKELTIADSKNLEVILSEDDNNLDEIVVIGYGTKSKTPNERK